jgi:hypothetical protein
MDVMYVERLERMLRAAWRQAVEGDLLAIECVLRVLATEAKFFGINN